WQIAVVNAVAGICWAAYNLASFNLLLELAPADARAEAGALFQLVIALSATLAPIFGGQLADAIGFKPLFILSAALRWLGAITFVWWVSRPAARRGRQAAQPTEAIASP